MSPSTASSSSTANGCEALRRPSPTQDEDEISVGCPSPLPLVVSSPKDEEDRLSCQEYERLSPRSYQDEEDRFEDRFPRMSDSRTRETDDEETEAVPAGTDDYFKPLKRLKMMPMQPSDEEDERERESTERGVKSFSILDILSHRPKAKIVRPWDTVETNVSHHRRHKDVLMQQTQSQLLQQQMRHSTPRDLSLMSMSLGSISGSISEPPLSSSSSSGRSSVSDSGSPDPLVHHHHHHMQALHPGLHHPAMQQQMKRKSSHANQTLQNGKRTPGQGSPLDALFQMTSKTFDAGEHSQGERFGSVIFVCWWNEKCKQIWFSTKVFLLKLYPEIVKGLLTLFEGV